MMENPSSAPRAPSVAEVRELLVNYAKFNWNSEPQMKGTIKIVVVALLGFIAMALGMFVVLVPVTYMAGGIVLHSERGWNMFQPGKGGARFVALNGFGWALYGIAIVLSVVNTFAHDLVLSGATFAVGLMCYAMICSSLLVFQSPQGDTINKQQVATPSEQTLKEWEQNPANVSGFSEEIQRSALLHNGQGPTDIWWLFIVMQTVGCIFAAWVGLATDLHLTRDVFRVFGTITVLWIMAGTTAITHAIGGQWRHISIGFAAFQPGKGGSTFVLLQAIGWTSFSLCEFLGLLALLGEVQRLMGRPSVLPSNVPLTAIAGFLGLIGQIVVALSLFHFEADKATVDSIEKEKMLGATVRGRAVDPKNLVFTFLRKTHFLGLNILFSGGKNYNNTRFPTTVTGPDDNLVGEEKMKRLLAEKTTCTNQQYLIVGCGFVGRHLVKRLLDRGETKIRIFDIVPVNPFPGNPNVEYVRGDVTKYDQVLQASQGVNVVYSTFAIIRFMDRLEWQAALSYRINVGGTENVLRACREANVDICVVTSSSHATTDEHSLPRLNRDETSPYVVRETAHNHYGWTKAIADQMCLKANGTARADGAPMRVAIVRPCSGVFGGDDRISFEKAMDMGVFPGVGSKSVMDWVHCDNVVLGHLLLEGAMQRNDPNVDGEAFNVSNNEGIPNEDFWFSVMKIIALCDPKRVKSGLDFIYVPEGPLWVIGYLSELNTKIFKGRVSLGKDLDMLSPGMLATATMHYSYNSDKAFKAIGYEPAFTVDQAIQKSLYEYWAYHYPEPKSVEEKKAE